MKLLGRSVPGARSILAAAGLILALQPLGAAEIFPMDLKLTPSGAKNTIAMTLEGDVLGNKKSDSDTGNLAGNMLAVLGMTFDPATHNVQSVDTLEMTGGRVTISDLSFSLSWFLVGTLDVSTKNGAGTFDTSNPPGQVTAGEFNALDHQLILNEGTFQAAGSGLIENYMPANPYVIELAAEPMTLTTDAKGTITVSAPIDQGGGAFAYNVTLTLPVSLDQIVFEEPGTASMRAVASGTIESKGRFVRAPDFGKVTPPMGTGLEEAEAGAASFVRTAGDKDLEWTMTAVRVNGTASVAATFQDPEDPGNLHQFHLTNADVVITTERIDLRGAGEVQLAIGLRVWDTSTGFEADDGVTLDVLLSQDGITSTEKRWTDIRGTAANALSKGQNGAFSVFRTLPGFIPEGTKSLQVVLRANNNSANEHLLWDNLQVVPMPLMRRGDCNANGAIDLSDAVGALFWLFQGAAAPPCQDACDSNDDGNVNISNVTFTLQWLFAGGTQPSNPGPFVCGPDPTPSLSPSCEASPACGP